MEYETPPRKRLSRRLLPPVCDVGWVLRRRREFRGEKRRERWVESLRRFEAYLAQRVPERIPGHQIHGSSSNRVRRGARSSTSSASRMRCHVARTSERSEGLPKPGHIFPDTDQADPEWETSRGRSSATWSNCHYCYGRAKASPGGRRHGASLVGGLAANSRCLWKSFGERARHLRLAMTSLRAFVRHGDSSQTFFSLSDAPLQPLEAETAEISYIHVSTRGMCEGVRAHECDSREISEWLASEFSLRKKGTEVGPRFEIRLRLGPFFQGRRLVAHRSNQTGTGIQIKGTMFPIASCRQAKVDDVGGRSERARTSKEEDRTPGAREREHPPR